MTNNERGATLFGLIMALSLGALLVIGAMSVTQFLNEVDTAMEAADFIRKVQKATTLYTFKEGAPPARFDALIEGENGPDGTPKYMTVESENFGAGDLTWEPSGTAVEVTFDLTPNIASYLTGRSPTMRRVDGPENESKVQTKILTGAVPEQVAKETEKQNNKVSEAQEQFNNPRLVVRDNYFRFAFNRQMNIKKFSDARYDWAPEDWRWEGDDTDGDGEDEYFNVGCRVDNCGGRNRYRLPDRDHWSHFRFHRAWIDQHCANSVNNSITGNAPDRWGDGSGGQENPFSEKYKAKRVVGPDHLKYLDKLEFSRDLIVQARVYLDLGKYCNTGDPYSDHHWRLGRSALFDFRTMYRIDHEDYKEASRNGFDITLGSGQAGKLDLLGRKPYWKRKLLGKDWWKFRDRRHGHWDKFDFPYSRIDHSQSAALNGPYSGYGAQVRNVIKSYMNNLSLRFADDNGIHIQYRQGDTQKLHDQLVNAEHPNLGRFYNARGRVLTRVTLWFAPKTETARSVYNRNDPEKVKEEEEKSDKLPYEFTYNQEGTGRAVSLPIQAKPPEYSAEYNNKFDAKVGKKDVQTLTLKNRQESEPIDIKEFIITGDDEDFSVDVDADELPITLASRSSDDGSQSTTVDVVYHPQSAELSDDEAELQVEDNLPDVQNVLVELNGEPEAVEKEGSKEFTDAKTYTWEVPAGVTTIRVTASAAGGGGLYCEPGGGENGGMDETNCGDGQDGANTTVSSSGATIAELTGGAGGTDTSSYDRTNNITGEGDGGEASGTAASGDGQAGEQAGETGTTTTSVQPGTEVTITVGAGGSGGTVNANDGNDGKDGYVKFEWGPDI